MCYLRGLMCLNRLLPMSPNSISVYLSIERGRERHRFQQADIRSARIHPSLFTPRETKIADNFFRWSDQFECAAANIARIYPQRFVLREMETVKMLSRWSGQFGQAATKFAPIHCSLSDHGAEISVTLSHGTDQLECAAAKAAPIRPCLSVRRNAMNFPNGSL
jgi:hypothetical protein